MLSASTSLPCLRTPKDAGMLERNATAGPTRNVVVITAVVLGLGACVAFDPWFAHQGLARADGTSGKQGDLYSLLRVMGYVPTWLFVGLALLLCRRVSNRLDINNFLWSFAPFFSCAIAGGLAAVLKIVFRRTRADQVDGAWYVFRPLVERPFSGSGLSMPSEHAAVAFGAAFMLSRMYPRGWPVFVLLGVGCAVTRIYSADHYLSDVYVAAIVGYITAWALVRHFGRRDQPLLLEEAEPT